MVQVYVRLIKKSNYEPISISELHNYYSDNTDSFLFKNFSEIKVSSAQE